jgi:vesicle-associated membrane protein 7
MTYQSNPDTKIIKLQENIGEVKEIMKKNIETVIERGENLEILLGRSEDLSANSNLFKKSSTDLKRQMCRRNCCYGLIITGIIIFIIFMVILLTKPWNSK